jgi:hypothetical protein
MNGTTRRAIKRQLNGWGFRRDRGDAIVACVELETIPQGKDFIVDKFSLSRRC